MIAHPCLYQDFVAKVEDEPAQSSISTEQPEEVSETAQARTAPQPTSDLPESGLSTHQATENALPPRPQEATETPQEDDLAEKTERLNIGAKSSSVPPSAPIAEPIAAPAPRTVQRSPTALSSTSNLAPAQASQATDSPEKPQSFKDKLAAFNRSATSVSGPPPPLKPKPLGSSGGAGTWAWKQKQQQAAAAEGNAKSGLTDSVSTEQQHPAPISNRESEESAQHPIPAGASGMSASDAKASIAAGGSLRERMAALAGAGAFGSDKPKGPPPPVASKPRVWKRPEQPVAAEPTPGSGVADVAQAGLSSGTSQPTGVDSDPAEHASAQQERPTEGAEQDQGEDEDEEQREKERRAAIAARMARLGGRGVMGMPMPIGGAKPVARQVETERMEETHETPRADEMESKNIGEQPSVTTSSLNQGPSLGTAEGSLPETATGTPATIAMPAIPRKAGPPRRKAPTRTDTGGSGISAAPSSPLAQEGASVPPLSSARIPESSTVSEPLPDPPVLREDIPSPTCEGDDREIPLPRTEEELAKEREYEEAGRGPRGAEGAEKAGIALATVGNSVSAEEIEKEVPSSHNEAPLHHERSLPPPPPPADEDDEDFGQPEDDEDEDDEDEDDTVMKQAASGGLLSRASDALDYRATMDAAQPVEFEPLQSPASTTGALPETPSLQQTVLSPPSAPQNLLGLPRDEVEMKREAESAEDTEKDPAPPPPPRTAIDANDEGERIKPAGPRPLPPSPARGLPPLQVAPNAPPTDPSTQPPRSPLGEATALNVPGAPLPTRQASVRSPSSAGPPVAVSAVETVDSPVEREWAKGNCDGSC